MILEGVHKEFHLSRNEKKNSNFFFMHVKFVKSLFGGCQNDFNVTKGGYIGGGVLLGPQKVIT